MGASYAQTLTDTATLKNITVTTFKNANSYTTITPVQQLDKNILQQLNSFSAGDAAKYFSGVLIKDYGGIGGLKTISVRSLGAAQTGVLYDDVAVADAQNGQIDLSKIPAVFLQRISLIDGGNFTALMPARSYSYAAVLSANTISSFPYRLKKQWQIGLQQGSVGLWQPFAGFSFPISKKTFITATATAIKAKGNYDFNIDNGTYSTKAKRDNGDVQSLNGEVNITTEFTDSSTLKTKVAVYTSERGLPGAIVFFNDRSAQRLWNTDAFVQSVFNHQFNTKTTVLFSAKYTHSYTRYLDPDFLNNEGKSDDHYNQNEVYASAAIAYNVHPSLQINYAADAAFTTLQSNKPLFAAPSRFLLWNVFSINYNYKLFQAGANVLYTHAHDNIKAGNSTVDKDKFTPAIAISFKPTMQSAFLFRAFYKRIFRLPTFNDLYYNLVGNTNLKPEFANQYNAGITFTKFISTQIQNLSFSVDGYYNMVKDKILSVPNKNLFIWSTLNLGKVDITGVDINAEAAGKFTSELNWFIKTAYTFQHAVDVTDKSSSSYKNQIPYTPKNSGSGIIQLTYKTYVFGYNTIFSGGRYTLGENSYATYVTGWITQDVSLSKNLHLQKAKLLVKAQLNNISNAHYDVVKYFPMQGRNYSISISINKN